MSCPRCTGEPSWTPSRLCGSCRLELGCDPTTGAYAETVGPFPAEPVLGSAEAVAQAAKTISGNPLPCGWCGAPSDGSICAEREELNLAAARTPEPVPAACSTGDREVCPDDEEPGEEFYSFLTTAQLEERLRAAVDVGDRAEEAFYAARLKARLRPVPLATAKLLGELTQQELRDLKAERRAELAAAAPVNLEALVESFAGLAGEQRVCAFAGLLGALSVHLKYSEKVSVVSVLGEHGLVENAIRAGAAVRV